MWFNSSLELQFHAVLIPEVQKSMWFYAVPSAVQFQPGTAVPCGSNSRSSKINVVLCNSKCGSITVWNHSAMRLQFKKFENQCGSMQFQMQFNSSLEQQFHAVPIPVIRKSMWFYAIRNAVLLQSGTAVPFGYTPIMIITHQVPASDFASMCGTCLNGCSR